MNLSKLPTISFLFACLAFLRADSGDQPNIVFILGDDQSWKDYGFMGSEVVSTPHIDALAAVSYTHLTLPTTPYV